MDDAASKPAYDGKSLAEQGAKWMERINAAEKREDRWRKDAEAAEKAFACDTETKGAGKIYDFNILHSNVETIVPAIYNSTPVPDIRRRFVEATGEPPEPPQQPQPGQPGPEGQPQQPPDPRQLQALQQQMASYQQAMQAYQQKMTMDEDAKNLGVMIERVIAVQIDDNRLDKEIEQEAQDAFLSGRGIVVLKFDADTEGEVVKNERLQFEAFSWRDFRMGPSTRWDNVPWIAFRHTVPAEQLEKHKDPMMFAAQGPFISVPSGEDDDGDSIPFWKVWCKETRKVKFIREHDGRILSEVDDPLGLPGFFPIPEPVQPISITGKMTPVCPFTVYKKLADELDTITKRINAIMKGLKVRGAIAGDASDIALLASAGDNELVPIANLEGLAQTKGLENAILWWPIEQSVKVLKELYVQRELVKTSIYEITGISDIVRGASNANETLGAQEIKTKWGALRIQKMQRMIERQVRDLFVMAADLIITKFSPQTLQQISGIQITPGMQALMQQPQLSGYRIDVESDSTVRADLTRQKGEMTEFLNGTAQFFAAIGPLVQESPQLAEPMAEVYSSFARVFKLGKQAEDALDRAAQMAKKAAKEPPPPNPEMQKMQGEMEMKKAEFGMKAEASKADMANKQQAAQIDSQGRTEELQIKREIAGIDKEMKLIDLAMKREELVIRKQELSMGLHAKGAETAMKLSAQKQSNELKAEQAKNGKAPQ